MTIRTPRRSGAFKRTAVALALSAVAASYTTGAFAQASGAEKAAAAQALYDDAMKSMAAKDYVKACPALERVTQLIPEGVGAKLSLAECYEAAGRLASAYGVYVATEGQARRAGQSDRADLAKQRMDALKPRLAMITIEVPAEIKGQPGFSLKRDGIALTEVEFGLALALDKGEHQLVATAEGRPAWQKAFTVEDGKSMTLKVEGPTPGPGGTTGGGTTGGGTTGGGTTGGGTTGGGTTGGGTTGGGTTGGTPPPATSDGGSFFGPGRIAGLSIGIGGVVAAGVGVALGVVGKGKYDESNETGGCNAETNVCTTQEGVDLRSSALTMANASTALVVIGSAMAAGGVILLIVAPGQDDGPSTGSSPARVQVGLGPGAVMVRGTF